MKDTERRRLEMFIRVREFGVAHAAQFPASSFAGEQFAALNVAVSALETHASAQSSGRGGARAGAAGKAAARDELMRDLEAISRTARAMALTTPGLEDKFRIPHNKSNQEVLAAARAVAADALPLKAEFIRRGMPADFLEDLAADITVMEQAISQKARGTESHIAATAAIDAEIERGMTAVRQLDPVVRNTFTSDPATLAAWFSASHVERAPRGSQTPAPQSTTTPAAPTA
ncbi:MAG TPA: hypothetical protein VN256_11145 [Pyrinomonadaceae bacterium]|nr:hypothetical protein [Pyrinomonadaceae bacterium]